MKGRVLNYSVQENGGIISGDDGNRYTFVGGQWREQALPIQGSYVDFQVDQDTDHAISIYLARGAAHQSSVGREE